MGTPEEFLHSALEEEIYITPLTKIPQLPLLENTYGPFDIYDTDCKLPIFSALILAKNNMLNIKTPTYLKSDYLETLIDQEKEKEDEFEPVYPYIFELYGTLVNYCYDVEDKTTIKALVDELFNIRQNKVMNGLKNIDSSALKINNLTGFEFERVKVYLVEVMELSKSLNKLNKV